MRVLRVNKPIEQFCFNPKGKWDHAYINKQVQKYRLSNGYSHKQMASILKIKYWTYFGRLRKIKPKKWKRKELLRLINLRIITKQTSWQRH